MQDPSNELGDLSKRVAGMEFRIAELERLITAKPYDDDQLFTARQLAQLIGYSYHTLKRWRTEGFGGPPYCKHGPNGAVRYRVAVVNKWLKNQQRTPIEFK